MNKQELLAKLNSSEELVKLAYVPVSEVIKWVTELEETSIDLKELEDQLIDEISNEGVSLIGDYDLEMTYREVELSSVDIDERTLKNAIQRAIESVSTK